MATKKINITLAPSQISWGKDESKKLFGKANLSGYIGYLISKEQENRKTKK